MMPRLSLRRIEAVLATAMAAMAEVGIAEVAIAEFAPDAVERGTWHWSGARDDHPYGTLKVVGDPEREAEVMEILRRWSIVRVYSSHPRWRFRREPDVLAAWNARLQSDGRRAFLLLSTTEWIFPERREDFRETLRELLIDFNASRDDPAERFGGLHLDIEPHTLQRWKTATPEEKRDLVLLLGETLAEARAFLAANGAADLPVYAALPVWIERLPPALGGRGAIGWESAAERDEWFAAVGRHVQAISLMAFETPHSDTILRNADWERENFAGKTIVALRADLGHEWNDIQEMIAAAAAIEAATGEGIDIQPFRRFAAKAGHLEPTLGPAQPDPET